MTARTKALRLVAAANFPSDLAAPLVRYTGRRANATATASGSSATLFPATAKAVEIRCTDSVYLRMGSSDVAPAAGDSSSDLIVAGEKIIVIPVQADGVTPYSHFRVTRVGSNDVVVQMAEVAVE